LEVVGDTSPGLSLSIFFSMYQVWKDTHELFLPDNDIISWIFKCITLTVIMIPDK
jgi:hypothetical protein